MNETEVYVKSYIGGRNEQQDSAASFKAYDILFSVVCDGMGGHADGAMASALAVEEFCNRFKTAEADNIPRAFISSIEDINHKVYSLKNKDGKRIKCGTTLTAAAVRNRQLYWISVGDSRLYICRNNKLIQVTEDHNYFHVLDKKLKDGLISREEYDEESVKGNSLISCIGMKKLGEIHLNIEPLKLLSGDVLLITSDGLYKALNDYQILSSMNGSAEEISDKLSEMILSADKKTLDNITYIIIKII